MLVQASVTQSASEGTDESTRGKDSSVPLMHHDSNDLGSLILVWITSEKSTLKAP